MESKALFSRFLFVGTEKSQVLATVCLCVCLLRSSPALRLSAWRPPSATRAGPSLRTFNTQVADPVELMRH